MKKPFKLVAMGSMLLTALSAYADALNSERYLEENRKTAQEFVQKLGGILKAQLETTGAEQAINVCKEAAPALAQEYSHNNKIVKRTNQTIAPPRTL